MSVAYPVGLLTTSETIMKSVAFGTAGLALSLCGSAMGYTPNPEISSVVQQNPGKLISPSKPQGNGTDNSFLVVDNWQQVGAQGLTNSPFGNRGVTSTADQRSVESSGNPADSSGVPVPGAGWISFCGVLGVIAVRRISQSRRRTVKAVMS